MKLYLAVFLVATIVAPACFAPQNGYYQGGSNSYYPQQQQQYNGYQQQNNGGYYPQQQKQYNNNYYKQPSYKPPNNYKRYNKQEKCGPVNLGCIVGNTLICDYDDSLTFVDSPHNMTNYRCAEFCGANYFHHSITLNGSVCYCLFEEDLVYQAAPSPSSCNAVCTGSQDAPNIPIDACGSTTGTFFTLSATSYNCIVNQQAVQRELLPNSCDAEFLQCASAASILARDDYLLLARNLTDMTNEYCASICSVYIYNTGYPLGAFMSATYGGNSCACLASPGTAVDASLCSAPCSGNQWETCGDDTETYATVSYTPSGCGLKRLRDVFY